MCTALILLRFHVDDTDAINLSADAFCSCCRNSIWRTVNDRQWAVFILRIVSSPVLLRSTFKLSCAFPKDSRKKNSNIHYSSKTILISRSLSPGFPARVLFWFLPIRLSGRRRRVIACNDHLIRAGGDMLQNKYVSWLVTFSEERPESAKRSMIDMYLTDQI